MRRSVFFGPEYLADNNDFACRPICRNSSHILKHTRLFLRLRRNYTREKPLRIRQSGVNLKSSNTRRRRSYERRSKCAPDFYKLYIVQADNTPQAIRKRRRQTASSEPSSDLELIASLVPLSQSSSDEEEDSETDDILREATLLLFRLTYTQAQSSLESLEQELELLRSMPPPPPPSEDQRRKSDKRAEQDDMWKLDAPIPRGGPDGKGPLLDPSGKVRICVRSIQKEDIHCLHQPLRPFTILPAGASDRTRLQSQVFQADHRLPTMSIDQYLEIEQQRGNIISGGG